MEELGLYITWTRNRQNVGASITYPKQYWNREKHKLVIFFNMHNYLNTVYHWILIQLTAFNHVNFVVLFALGYVLCPRMNLTHILQII